MSSSSLTSPEAAIVEAVAMTMTAAAVLAHERDRMVRDDKHTFESACGALVAEYGGTRCPVADLIDWFDRDYSYTSPAFARILDCMNVSPELRADVLASGARADSEMAKLQAAVRKVH